MTIFSAAGALDPMLTSERVAQNKAKPARELGFCAATKSRFSPNYFVRSVSRWDIQLLEDEHEQEHEHDFSISDFRFNRQVIIDALKNNDKDDLACRQ